MPIDMKALVAGLYDLLTPADPADRRKAIKAALSMLGDDPSFVEQKKGDAAAADDAAEDHGEFNVKARTWMRQNKLDAEQLEHVFHIDGEAVDIIAHKVPGASLRDRVVNTYVLVGLRELIRTGEPKFDEETAKDECERLGTHGKTNHTAYAKSGGNLLAGSAKKGWALTAPGMKAGAELVKELTTDE